MEETYYVGAYWPKRKESAGQCASRAARFFQCLAQCDPLFTHWFERKWSRKEALQHEITINEEQLLRLFLGDTHDTKLDPHKVEETGFSIGLWTGGDSRTSAGLDIKCGCFFSPIRNSCVIDLPYEGPVADRVIQVSVLTAIVKCIVSAWEPIRVVVNSDQYSSQFKGTTLTGWITYMAKDIDELPVLPQPMRKVPMDSLGSLILITNEHFTANNPQHIEWANQLMTFLKRTDLYDI